MAAAASVGPAAAPAAAALFDLLRCRSDSPASALPSFSLSPLLSASDAKEEASASCGPFASLVAAVAPAPALVLRRSGSLACCHVLLFYLAIYIYIYYTLQPVGPK